MLHLSSLTHRYGQVTAVDDLSIDITGGTVHAIIGPNGAGKSTLLNLIAGTLAPDRGRIVLDGVDITRHRADRRARAGIGRTFQHPGIFTDLTVIANLALAVRPRTRRDRDQTAERMRDLLRRIGLSPYAYVPAGRLSYGQRRLLEITMALAGQPCLLLLDEPSAGLSPHDLTQVIQALRDLPDDVTVVLVDHHLDLVWAVADAITVLDHGRLLTTGTAAHVRTHPDVQAAYLGDTAATPSAARSPSQDSRVELQIRRLSASYQAAAVLDGLDLDVKARRIHALLGRNGAGKTTLINSIAGLHPRSPGATVYLAGYQLAPGEPETIADLGVALVPQGRRLFANLTGAEHLALAERYRFGRHGSRLRRDDVLDLLPALHDALDRYPHQLSGGQQQILALARALLTGSRLLLLDEPSEGLAPTVAADLATILVKLTDLGATVLLAEQNAAFALTVAADVSILEQGRITTTGAANSDSVRRQIQRALGIADTPTLPRLSATDRATRS